MLIHCYRLFFVGFFCIISTISIAGQSATPMAKSHPYISVNMGLLSASLSNHQLITPNNDLTRFYYDNDGPTSTRINAGIAIGVEALFPLGGLYYQFGIALQQSGNLKTNGTLTQGVDANTLDTFFYNYQLRVQQAIAEAKLIKNFSEVFDGYVLAGIGLGRFKIHNYKTQGPSFITFTPQYIDHNQNKALGAVGLGFQRKFNKHWRVGIEGRYLYSGNIRFDNASLDSTTFNYPLNVGHLKAFNAQLIITYLAQQ